MPALARSVTRAATSAYATGQTASLYFHASTEAAATVLTAGYFNAQRDDLKVGDVILVSAGIGGTADILMLHVTAAPATGNVTVAANTGASGS